MLALLADTLAEATSTQLPAPVEDTMDILPDTLVTGELLLHWTQHAVARPTVPRLATALASLGTVNVHVHMLQPVKPMHTVPYAQVWASPEPATLRKPHQTVRTPGSRPRRNAVVSMCRRISQTLRLSSSPTLRNPQEESRNKIKKKEDIVFEEETGKYFWSMSGDFVHRHHEVRRSKLYDPGETIFSSPLHRCHEANKKKHRKRLRARAEGSLE